MNILSGFDSSYFGQVYYKNINWKEIKNKHKYIIRKKNIGFIYQFHYLLPEFSIIENISMPLIINNIKKKQVYEMSYALLKKIGLENKCNMKPFQLSGGEKQKISLGRSIIMKPDCIIADEPTGNLDTCSSLEIVNQLLEINRKDNTAVVLVTHDNFISNFMKKKYILKKGYLERVY